ncbi:MAG: hypothetical protein JSV80_06545, partial [Acidobacteriota bacterium]
MPSLRPDSKEPADLVFARGLLALFALGTATALRFVVGVPVRPSFFALVAAWFAVAAVLLLRLAPPPESVDYTRLRTALLCFEIVVATLGAHLLGLTSWLVVPLVLLPVLEHTIQYPGRRGQAAAVLGGVAAAAVVAFDAVWRGVAGGTAAAGEGIDPAGAVVLAVLACLLVLGVETGVGRVAAIHHDHRAELENANAELQSAQAELVNTARMATLGTLVAGVAHELN